MDLPVEEKLFGHLSVLLADARSTEHLLKYFAEPADEQRPASVFGGRLFEQIGCGGDLPSVCDRVTAEDLIAVQSLSAKVPTECSASLLGGQLGRRVRELLKAIPTDIPLGANDAQKHVRPDSAAARAWHLLRATHGMGYVTTGKLLARKRPHLIPVYDQVVSCRVGRPKDFWVSLHGALALDEQRIPKRLRELRIEAEVPHRVSDLRVLDVVIWMGHRIEHKTCVRG